MASPAADPVSNCTTSAEGTHGRTPFGAGCMHGMHPAPIAGSLAEIAGNAETFRKLRRARGTGKRKRVAETAPTPRRAAADAVLAAPAPALPTSGQCGYGGANRRRQPAAPGARAVGRVDQVLAHLQRAVRQRPRLGVGGGRVFVRLPRRIGFVVADDERRIAPQFGEQRLGQERIVGPPDADTAAALEA